MFKKSGSSSQYENMSKYELGLQASKKDTDINEVISEASKRVADKKMQPFELSNIIAKFSPEKQNQIKRESFFPYISVSNEEAVKILYGIKNKIGSYAYNVGNDFNSQRFPHFGSFTNDIEKINLDSLASSDKLSELEERIIFHAVLARATNEARGTSYANRLEDIFNEAKSPPVSAKFAATKI